MSGELTFSIIIPAYNRSALIGRAIASCLIQDHPAFEVIVVDDGSTDGTAERVSEIVDPRVRLLAQPVNRGVSPARNLAAEHARGEWIVCLDSDDELTPDALALMEADIERASSGVDGFRFMCRLDDGSLSPAPPLRREVWDYEAYLRWADESTRGAARETLTCFRRENLRRRQIPGRPGAGAAVPHGFCRALPNGDEPCRRAPLPRRRARSAHTPEHRARAGGRAGPRAKLETLLDRHGAALARWAPGLLVQYTRGLATQQFLAGDRAEVSGR